MPTIIFNRTAQNVVMVSGRALVFAQSSDADVWARPQRSEERRQQGHEAVHRGHGDRVRQAERELMSVGVIGEGPLRRPS
jgi:hypothetical protein